MIETTIQKTKPQKSNSIFLQLHDHHWKPSILTKCSNIRECSWYRTVENHGIGPHSLISESPIMRIE